MRLKELAEFQEGYSHLEQTKMTKKSLCDLVIPFRDKYGLSDGQALRIARREFPLKKIEELMKGSSFTNADRIRAMSDKDLAFAIICPRDMGADITTCADTCMECSLRWLQEPAKEEV